MAGVAADLRAGNLTSVTRTWPTRSRSLLPLVVASGSATVDEIEVDTLAKRLRAETLAHGGVAKAPDLVSAWARKA